MRIVYKDEPAKQVSALGWASSREMTVGITVGLLVFITNSSAERLLAHACAAAAACG